MHLYVHVLMRLGYKTLSLWVDGAEWCLMNLSQLNQRNKPLEDELIQTSELESRNGHCFMFSNFKITRNYEKWWLNSRWCAAAIEGRKT